MNQLLQTTNNILLSLWIKATSWFDFSSLTNRARFVQDKQKNREPQIAKFRPA